MVIENNKLYEFLIKKSEVAEQLSNKELTLCVFSGKHLETYHSYNLGAGITVAGLSTISTFVVENPICLSLLITFGVAGVINACKNVYSNHKNKKLVDIFTKELTSRYSNPIEAYVQIRLLIENTSREEILSFIEEANNN